MADANIFGGEPSSLEHFRHPVKAFIYAFSADDRAAGIRSSCPDDRAEGERDPGCLVGSWP